jgi:electron transfer flavoprotein beta subunit
MDSVVLIKQVPDTAAPIQDYIRDGSLDLSSVAWVVSPYEEYATEEALRLREKHGGSVTLLTLAPERADEALKSMLALGADEAVRVWDSGFEGLGPYARAQVLAAALNKLPYDMIWGGWKAVDEDYGLVPIYVAQLLDLPHISFVVDIAVEGRRAKVKREVEGGKEILEVDLPAVFTAQKGLNEVRYASLKGIMAVKRKTIAVWDTTALGLDAEQLLTPRVKLIEMRRPPQRAPGRMLSGTPHEIAAELIRALREEAKAL